MSLAYRIKSCLCRLIVKSRKEQRKTARDLKSAELRSYAAFEKLPECEHKETLAGYWKDERKDKDFSSPWLRLERYRLLQEMAIRAGAIERAKEFRASLLEQKAAQ